MVGVASNPKDGRSRLCLCCGEPTATRSIPACWDHWIALPEDLQSAIVISTGRGEIGRYGDCLMEAVRIWRQTGLWRSRYVKTESAPQELMLAVSPRAPGTVTSFRAKRANRRRRQKQNASPRSASGSNDRPSANLSERMPAASAPKR